MAPRLRQFSVRVMKLIEDTIIVEAPDAPRAEAVAAEVPGVQMVYGQSAIPIDYGKKRADNMEVEE